MTDTGPAPAAAPTRCVHDMLPGQCADCTGRDGGLREELARQRAMVTPPHGTAIRARYPGFCTGCGEHYEAGTPINRRHGRETWRAACCLNDVGWPVR